MTASVAVAVTWLSLAATPASTARAYEPRREQAALPYDLLLRLTGLRSVPAIAAEDSKELYRAAGLISPDITGPLDRMLAAEREAAKPQLETRMLKVDNGDTIVSMLQEAGVSKLDAAAVVDAMKPLISAKNIRSGQTFKATFGSPKAAAAAAKRQGTQTAEADQDDEDSSPTRRLLSLSFAPSIDRQINVHLAPEEGYFAEDVQSKLEAHYQHAGATIDSSLYLAAMQAGIPASLVVEIIRMFSYEVDFQRDVHQGDEFEVFFNRYFTSEGQPAKAGDILAASMTLSGKKHLLYRFRDAGRRGRIFRRQRPKRQGHADEDAGGRRADFIGLRPAASPDPRLYADAQGHRFRGAGRNAGHGGGQRHGGLCRSRRRVRQPRRHQSRQQLRDRLWASFAFRVGIRAGARVHQGDVVAYSGMTGLATGPHLHYEIRVKNAQVNPATVKIASGRKLEGDELKAFFAERAHIEQLEASLPIQSRLAQAWRFARNPKVFMLGKIAPIRLQCTAWLGGGSKPPISPSASPDGSTSLPLTIRPCLPAETVTVSPSEISPSRMRFASGSCRLRWITRFKGRAP